MTIPQSPVEVLRAARKLIEVPERWTQGALARNALGRVTLSYGEDGVCWCSYGALTKVTAPDKTLNSDYQAAGFLAKALGTNVSGISTWNDRRGRKHAAVVAAFDRAIALAEQSIPSTTVNALDAGKGES